ncbi:MAG: MFS transporter, partial [Acidobacteriota bacterium]|nr:MFS transporter [Acidobacteriota bacterium]
MPRPHSPPLKYGVILSLFLLLFTGLADNQMIAALLPDLMQSFRVSVAVAGMLVVVYSIAAAFAGFIAGALSDHYGRRRFLLGGVLLFALASWWASETVTFSQLMMARALTGAAAGTISTCALTLAGDSFDYAVRGRAIGLISVAYFAAPIIGVPAGAQIADRFGWRITFVFFAFVACLAAASMWLLRNEEAGRTGSERNPGKLRTTARSMRSFLVRRDLSAGIVIAFLVSGGMVGFLTYIGEWLNHNFGLTTRGIGWVFMLGGLVAVAGAPLGGILSDRWGKRRVSIVGSIILAISLAVMPFFPWGVLLLVVFGLTSLGTAFRQGPVTALMTELIPWRQRGAYMAARGVFSQFGIAATAFAGG